MATGIYFYIDGTQIAPRVASSDIASSGTHRNLLEVNLGKVSRRLFEDERPGMDGMRRRGSVFGARDMVWKIKSEVNPAVVSAANMERVRADEVTAINRLLMSDSVLELRVERTEYPTTAISRVIYADATEISSWEWQKTGIDDGFVGRYDMPMLVMTVPFRCPFPWWMDEVETQTAELTLDGTLRTTTITNTGEVACGLKFNVEGSTAAGLTVQVLNATVGPPASLAGEGITLSGITLHATNGWTVDQYVGDPQAFQAYREADGSSILGYLAPKPRVWLAKGVNTISYRVTAGTPSGGETIQFSHRNLWSTP